MKLLRRLGMLFLVMGLFAWALFGGEGKVSGPEPSVHIRSAQAVHQADGTYQVRVLLTTDATVHPGEALEISVSCADQRQSLPLTADTAGEVHSLEFSLSEQPEEVRAAVGRSEGEPLGADTAAPVDGDRRLILQGAAPGAVYRLCLVAELWQVLSCPLELCPDPEAATVAPDSPGATLTADSEGNASLNLTRAGLPDGLYLLEGEGKSQYVCLPRVDASGELLSSVVTVSGNS